VKKKGESFFFSFSTRTGDKRLFLSFLFFLFIKTPQRTLLCDKPKKG